MKKWILFLILFSMSFRGVIYAQEDDKDSRLGMGAYEGQQSSIKWGVAVGGIGVAGVVFALIIILASTDPTTFSHDHS